MRIRLNTNALGIAGALLGGAILLYAAGCAPSKPAASPPPVSAATPAPTPAAYVGDETCNACHPDIFRAHRASNHHKTMRVASKEAMGDQFPAAGKIPGFNYTLVAQKDVLLLSSPVHPEASVPLAYALGAGKQGVTFVCPTADRRIIEIRLSYLPHHKEWFPTPGQDKDKDGGLGTYWNPARSQRCIACHALIETPGSFPADNRFGVTCEVCHGAGGAHAEGMQHSRSAPLALERLGKAGGKAINTLCGRCHRSEDNIDFNNATQKGETQRFQPWGLSLSKCFKNSADGLTCLTCHDPHRNATQEAKAYVKTCLTCHTPGVQPPVAVAKVIACPVNPKADCIRCHMPQTPLLVKRGKRSVEMADHYIRPHPELR